MKDKLINTHWGGMIAVALCLTIWIASLIAMIHLFSIDQHIAAAVCLLAWVKATKILIDVLFKEV